MARIKKRTFTISVNGKIYSAIEIHGDDTEDIISKIENLMKKFMWLNYNHNLKIWEKISKFHYHAVDPDSKKHYDIKLNIVMLWTDDGLNEQLK